MLVMTCNVHTYQMKSKRAIVKIPIKTIMTGTTMAAARWLASRTPLGTAAAVETSTTGSVVVIGPPVVTVCTEAEILANWLSGIWLVMAFTVLT